MQTEVKNAQKSVGDSVFKYMRKELIYAVKIEIVPDSTKKGSATKDINVNGTNNNAKGELLVGTVGKEENVLGSTFYNQYTVAYSVEALETEDESGKTALDKRRLKLKVIVKDKEGKAVYETEGTIKNLSIAEDEAIVFPEGDNPVFADSPVIYFDSEIKIETTPAPLQLYLQMKETYESYLAANQKQDANLLPKDYATIVNSNLSWFSNDNFRKYINQYYYHGKPYSKDEDYESWPTFPGFTQGIIDRVDTKVRNAGGNDQVTLSAFLMSYGTTPIKTMVYFNVGDKSYYVYVPAEQGQKWTARLLYYYDPAEENTDPNGPQNGDWYYYYKQNKTDKRSISSVSWSILKDEVKSGSAADGGHWIKVE